MSWEQIKLGDNVIISKGKKHDAVPNGKYKYINIDTLHNPFNSLYTNETGNVVKENDIVIAWDGANSGKVGVGLKGVIGSTLAKLDLTNENIDSYYLYWFLESQNEVIKSQRTGATIPHVNGSALKDMNVPLPPLPIQKRIAEILNAADALRKKDQELLKKYDELAQAIFIDMFGDPVRNEKGWDENRIKNLASNSKHSIKAGPFGSSLKKEYYVSNGYKIYGQEQVIADNFDIGDYYITFQKYKELENCKIESGDVLISLVGTYGKISVVPEKFEPGIINPRLMKISLNKGLFNPYFFKYLLQTVQMTNRIKSFSRGGTMDIVNVGIISDVIVVVPPLKLQNQFVEILQCIEEQKNLIIKGQSNILFNSLIQNAFNIKVDNNNLSNQQNEKQLRFSKRPMGTIL